MMCNSFLLRQGVLNLEFRVSIAAALIVISSLRYKSISCANPEGTSVLGSLLMVLHSWPSSSTQPSIQTLIMFIKRSIHSSNHLPELKERMGAETFVEIILAIILPPIGIFLRCSFNELIPCDLISIFNDKELELLISGLPEIDLDDLMAHSEYTGYTVGSNVVVWFWEVVKAFNKEDKVRLLQFQTGTSKIFLNTRQRNSFRGDYYLLSMKLAKVLGLASDIRLAVSHSGVPAFESSFLITSTKRNS
ncbi:hypothetical protein L6452_03028 [Arctium lappa]|uniref:Uncharacterized protein n=1 Tax=Arctium lappa TaxID=4217 RepID=A0ACB9FL20_ARCLA|nr:hypothetical protein L6452_03028 [Arctium lappa]